MSFGKRQAERVDFAHGVKAHIMAIDGSWRRECTMFDVSQSGARLHFESGVNGLELTEFFLMLSTTGKVHRRCELVRVHANEIGVRFVEPERKPKSKSSVKFSD
jgi:hypothetical protein